MSAQPSLKKLHNLIDVFDNGDYEKVYRMLIKLIQGNNQNTEEPIS